MNDLDEAGRRTSSVPLISRLSGFPGGSGSGSGPGPETATRPDTAIGSGDVPHDPELAMAAADLAADAAAEAQGRVTAAMIMAEEIRGLKEQVVRYRTRADQLTEFNRVLLTEVGRKTSTPVQTHQANQAVQTPIEIDSSDTEQAAPSTARPGPSTAPRPLVPGPRHRSVSELMREVVQNSFARNIHLHRVSYWGHLDDGTVIFPVKLHNMEALEVFLDNSARCTYLWHRIRDLLEKYRMHLDPNDERGVWVQGISGWQYMKSNTNSDRTGRTLTTKYYEGGHVVQVDVEHWNLGHATGLFQNMIQHEFL